MIDVDRGVVAVDHLFPAWHAAPDDAGDAVRLRHQFPRPRPAHLRARRRSGRRGRRRSAPARRRPRARTGAGRFPTTTGRSRSKRASTPIRIRASRRTARAWCSPRTGPATRSSTRSMLEDAMNADGHAGKPARPRRKSAPAASPAPAAGSRTASCSAISRSCRRNTRSTSCCIASATSAPARCWKSPIPAASGAEEARADRGPAHRLRPLRDLPRRRAHRGPHRHHGPVARRPRHLPDRLGHQHRRRAGARRRADPQGPLGAAHRRCRPSRPGRFAAT